MELRPYQNEAVRAVEGEWEQGRTKTLLVLPTGCHAAGEKLLMADGETKEVESINIGDKLMGPDGTPRTVLYKKEGTGKGRRSSESYRYVASDGTYVLCHV